jgi:DAACS family dicarboxylate/amino acid:cation (Na+ or H+) symporter/aerobic C4-dicarboxylate transport protein
MKRLSSTLYFQVLLGLLLGGLIGYFFPHAGIALKPLGDGFIKLIKMLLGPIIFLTVVLGVAKMGDVKRVGRVGLKAIVYFEIVSSFALIIGLAVGNLFHPGSTMHIDPATLDAKAVQSYASSAQPHSVADFFLNIIPSSPLDAFARGDMLQIILFSVLLGVALSRLAGRVPTLLTVLEDFLQGMFGIVGIVMRLSPLGAGGAMAYTIASYGIASLASYGKLIGCLYVTAALFIFVVLGAISTLCRISFWKFLRFIREEILVTFGTASTEAVLPAMMSKLEQLGCERTVVGLVLPTGYSFNADGTSIYLTMAVLFIAQATGIHLSLADELTILAVALFTSKGIAGVAGGGFVALAATLASTNKIPIAALVLLLGIDRLLDEARAVTNLIGNGIATIAVAKWERQFDQERAIAVLDRRVESQESFAEDTGTLVR